MKIILSAMGPSVAEQVAAMGLEQSGDTKLDFIDRMAHAITLLHIHGALTDAETTRARTRIMKKLKLREQLTPNAQFTGAAKTVKSSATFHRVPWNCWLGDGA